MFFLCTQRARSGHSQLAGRLASQFRVTIRAELSQVKSRDEMRGVEQSNLFTDL